GRPTRRALVWLLSVEPKCFPGFLAWTVILSLRRIRNSSADHEKLDRSFVACPARSEPASGAHGFLLRMTRNSWEASRGRGRPGLRRGAGPRRGRRARRTAGWT